MTIIHLDAFTIELLKLTLKYFSQSIYTQVFGCRYVQIWCDEWNRYAGKYLGLPYLPVLSKGWPNLIVYQYVFQQKWSARHLSQSLICIFWFSQQSRRFSTFLVSFPTMVPWFTITITHKWVHIHSIHQDQSHKISSTYNDKWPYSTLHIPIQNSHYFWATGCPLIDELTIYLTIPLLWWSDNASLPHEGEKPRHWWFIKMFSVYSWSIVGSLAWWKLNF